ncbi:hypothetical protein [Ekhidna sp. To15]|uniref:hypothetical protein n=1 Tax=Ekhidna sp. To15 TaxID=3395267 RepID=UPI003F51B134
MSRSAIIEILKSRSHLFLIACFFANCAIAQQDNRRITITISSSNLSEDFGIASSKNDELLLLIYEFPNQPNELSQPVFVKEFILDATRMESKHEWLYESPIRDLIFFLIERDSERTELQIDPVLRVYFKNIIDCSDRRDYLCIEKYLEDEDMIGYSRFSIPSVHNLNGIYKLDKFNYTITFQDR